MSIDEALIAWRLAPREPLRCDCSPRARLVSSASALHEVALHAGFRPEEATTLSFALAELATVARCEERGGSAAVYLHADGWRLEVPGTVSPRALITTPSGGTRLTTATLNGIPVAVAEYERG